MMRILEVAALESAVAKHNVVEVWAAMLAAVKGMGAKVGGTDQHNR